MSDPNGTYFSKNELSEIGPARSGKASFSTVAALRASLSQSGALRRFAVSFPSAALPFYVLANPFPLLASSHPLEALK